MIYYKYLGYGWFEETDQKPERIDTSIWTMTPLFERPKWKRIWFYIFGWPSNFKPTGYKGMSPIHLKDIVSIKIDGAEHKFTIAVPEKL